MFLRIFFSIKNKYNSTSEKDVLQINLDCKQKATIYSIKLFVLLFYFKTAGLLAYPLIKFTLDLIGLEPASCTDTCIKCVAEIFAINIYIWYLSEDLLSILVGDLIFFMPYIKELIVIEYLRTLFSSVIVTKCDTYFIIRKSQWYPHTKIPFKNVGQNIWDRFRMKGIY